MISWMIGVYAVCSSLFVYRYRSRHYLRYFQQEEYEGKRFLLWIARFRVFDKKASLVALTALAGSFLFPYPFALTAFAATVLIVLCWRGEDPLSSGKIRLVMTSRATRIYRLAGTLYSLTLFGFVAALFLFAGKNALPLFWLLTFIMIQSTPLWLLLATCILSPAEKRVQKKYALEAKNIFASRAPIVIGITGSYGKTSTKQILGEMLQATLGSTFWPPKGINTLMGITRAIRETMAPLTKYAVIEMGAYHRGSIEKLCRFTPPQAAIVTAVGLCHLERFGSEEDIYLGKAEIAHALPDDGILVCNGDDSGARRIAVEYPRKTTLLYGFDNNQGDLSCWISTHTIDDKGMIFTITWEGKEYHGRTSFFGTTALSNGMAAFTMACALGADPSFALGIFCSHEPVDNRLQVKKSSDVVYIHDAYNSNPVGFAAALEVARALPAKRRIVMTPGMIELGSRQDDENAKVAQKAGAVCDYAIVVGETNKSSLFRGLSDGGMFPENIFFCSCRDDAFKRLHAIADAGDVVLIENDLPDVYETKVAF